jgi:hypothetical protein
MEMKRSLLLLVAVASATLLLAPAAQAAYDPLASGTTKLTLDKSFLKLLKQNGAKVSAVAPAKLKGTTASFPVSGGKFDPVSSKGTVEHEGALRFSSKAGSIPLRALQLKTTQKRSPFSAKAGGGQLKIATAKSLSVTRQGFAEEVKVTKLSLSQKLATRLAKKLKLKGVLKEGLPLGSAVTKANPETINVEGKGRVSLALDPAFAAKLDSLFVAVNPIFPAERPGPFTLQTFGGTIAPDGSQGTIETSGALEFLQLGGGQVFWKEPSLDLTAKVLGAEVEVLPSPPYAGKAGRVGVAGIAAAGFSADPKQRTVSLSAAALLLDAGTAQAFNEVFAKPQGREGVFVAGEAVGVVSFVVEGE